MGYDGLYLTVYMVFVKLTANAIHNLDTIIERVDQWRMDLIMRSFPSCWHWLLVRDVNPLQKIQHQVTPQFIASRWRILGTMDRFITDSSNGFFHLGTYVVRAIHTWCAKISEITVAISLFICLAPKTPFKQRFILWWARWRISVNDIYHKAKCLNVNYSILSDLSLPPLQPIYMNITIVTFMCPWCLICESSVLFPSAPLFKCIFLHCKLWQLSNIYVMLNSQWVPRAGLRLCWGNT